MIALEPSARYEGPLVHAVRHGTQLPPRATLAVRWVLLLGGLILGAGGLLLGLALSYVSGYEGSALVPLAALVILMAVLMIRPTGLFAASKERRV